jgi:O-antigen/teichoic acid export membrane protein
MLSISFFGIVSGFSNIAILNIDKYMIERYVGLSGVGVYSITFYFATMILLPARSIQKIATIILSESWKNNDLKNINTIYYKSTITQLIIGSYIFIGIWVNIDNIISILGPEYKDGVYVIFFIGLANMVYMLSGLSAYIITTSKKYIYSSIFMLIMLVLIVVTNLIFIPIYGIVGAALASFISMLGVSILRFIFIWKNFAIQPYNFQHLIIIGIVIISYYSAFFIPDSFNPFVNIMIKGTIVSLVFALLIMKTSIKRLSGLKIK